MAWSAPAWSPPGQSAWSPLQVLQGEPPSCLTNDCHCLVGRHHLMEVEGMSGQGTGSCLSCPICARPLVQPDSQQQEGLDCVLCRQSSVVPRVVTGEPNFQPQMGRMVSIASTWTSLIASKKNLLRVSQVSPRQSGTEMSALTLQ